MQILLSWVSVSSESIFGRVKIWSTYIGRRNVAEVIGSNFPDLIETTAVRVQDDLVACCRHVLHFHIMPTKGAACARELLIVMTAKVFCRLVVTTRFVKVQIPDQGSDTLHVGGNVKKKRRKGRMKSGSNQIFQSSWRLKPWPWLSAGSAEVKLVAIRRATTESLDSMIAALMVSVLKKLRYVLDKHLLFDNVKIELWWL